MRAHWAGPECEPPPARREDLQQPLPQEAAHPVRLVVEDGASSSLGISGMGTIWAFCSEYDVPVVYFGMVLTCCQPKGNLSVCIQHDGIKKLAG